MSELSYLSHARYGKDMVRVLRVVRDGSWHTVVEYNVKALVEGDIETRYVSSLYYTLRLSTINVEWSRDVRSDTVPALAAILRRTTLS